MRGSIFMSSPSNKIFIRKSRYAPSRRPVSASFRLASPQASREIRHPGPRRRIRRACQRGAIHAGEVGGEDHFSSMISGVRTATSTCRHATHAPESCAPLVSARQRHRHPRLWPRRAHLRWTPSALRSRRVRPDSLWRATSLAQVDSRSMGAPVVPLKQLDMTLEQLFRAASAFRRRLAHCR